MLRRLRSGAPGHTEMRKPAWLSASARLDVLHRLPWETFGSATGIYNDGFSPRDGMLLP